MSDWDQEPILFLTPAHCPHCLALRPIIIRTSDNGDGSKTRRCVCRECSRRFVLCVEPPETLPEVGSEGVEPL